MIARSIAALAWVLAAACGDDGAPPAGMNDGSTRDGGGDTGPRPDAGAPGCTAEAPIELGRDEAGGSIAIAAAGGPDSFLIVWTSAAGVSALSMPSDGVPGEPVTLAAAGTSIAVVWADTEWIAAWAEDGDLQLRTISADGAELGAAAHVTDDALDDRAPSLVAAGGDVIAAWIRGDEVVAARAGSDGVLDWGPTALGTTGTEGDVGVAPLGEGDYFAVWSEPPVVRSRMFGFAGSTRGEATAFDSSLFAAGAVAAAGGPLAGGVLFEVTTSGTRDDLRLQPLGIDGMPSGAADLATVDGVWGRSPALARFAGGWAGFWRGGQIGTGHARIGLFSVEGDSVLQLAIGSLASLDGDVALAVASDGTLLAVWTDREPAGPAILSAARIVCRG